jgi:hypothetical protein
MEESNGASYIAEFITTTAHSGPKARLKREERDSAES